MKKISLISAKGGVGKTTTAVNLSAALAAKGKRVLLIDADAQASATFHLGMEPDDVRGTAAILFGQANLADCCQETNVPGLHLLAGSSALAAVDVTLATKVGRERVLANALKRTRRYDFAVIDCPPAQGLTMANALVASNYLLVPVVPAYLSMTGVLDTLEFIEEVEEGIGKCAKLLGMVICMKDSRKKGHQEYVEGLRKTYKKLVFRSEIRTNAPLEVAPSHGQTVFQFDAASRGAQEYAALAAEVLRKVKK